MGVSSFSIRNPQNKLVNRASVPSKPKPVKKIYNDYLTTNTYETTNTTLNETKVKSNEIYLQVLMDQLGSLKSQVEELESKLEEDE